jgi:MFS family permease
MMLPALPDIAATFHVSANKPQEALSTFLIGFGIGQFIMGPLSDRFGRRPVLCLTPLRTKSFGQLLTAPLVRLGIETGIEDAAVADS